jgi:hypothetical protein
MAKDDDIMIVTPSGEQILASSIGIHTESFSPPAPNYTHTYTPLAQHRVITTNAQLQQRTIPWVFDVCSNDKYDQSLQRLEVFRLLGGSEDFYVIDMRVPFIRWPVHVDGGFSVSPYQGSNVISDDVTVNLIVSEGYGETIAASDQLDEVFAFGLLPSTDDYDYSFTNQTSCKVYIAGVIPIRTDEHPMLIKFHGDVAKALTIKNLTTNQTFTLTKPLTKSQELLIWGNVPAIDGTQVYGSSNHAYLDFQLGFNDIAISGATNFDVTFSTRFYY